ncbi:kynureninase [Pseudoduganella sp.]|uniref:kynureninase n=1 Tax=Pseudoduganella sp. TaxID=1880898 RepID=UPI0035AEFD4D
MSEHMNGASPHPLPRTREAALALDHDDPLARSRSLFELPAGLIYLDGNSLGALPRATTARLQQMACAEWGRHLVGAWNDAGWVNLPHRIADKICQLVGAQPGELVVTDSTSINTYKVLHAALGLARRDRPRQRVIISERDNFPTDLYIAHAVAEAHGCVLVLAEAPEQIPDLLERGDAAVLLLTHVNYRTGRMHDMAALNRLAQRHQTFTVWDLAHSAGAVPVDLNGSGSDFAVGCGYKYLNGGPGAPAFVWVHARLADRCHQPLPGWFGHMDPFAFSPAYQPAAGSRRFLCGTPPLLSMAALECGVDTLLAAGDFTALRQKSIALTSLFIDEVERRCAGHGLTLVTPRDPAARGSQVCFSHPEGGYPIMQALIARGVVGDFRAPGILRFGFAPLYTRYTDAWDAAAELADVLATNAWRDARYARRGAVT